MRDNSPVLLVEDDLVDAMTVSRSFQDLDITNKIEHCVNGVEALARLQEMTTKPSIILLDINMPKMDGMECAKVIRNMADPIKSTIPILAITGNAKNYSIDDFKEVGINEYIPKPLNFDVLVDKVKKYTEADD